MVERAVPGIKGLSFVNDIGWRVEGKDGEAVAAKLTKVAVASLNWVASNRLPLTTERQRWHSLARERQPPLPP